MYVFYKKRSTVRCGLFYLNIQTYKWCCLLVYCLLFKTEVREWTDKWSWSIYCLLDQRDYTSFSSKYGLDTEVQHFYEIIKSRTMKFFITTNLDDIKCWTWGRGQTNNPNMLKEKHYILLLGEDTYASQILALQLKDITLWLISEFEYSLHRIII